MEIYKHITQDNGDILLEKININLEDYEIITFNNGNKILRNINYIQIDRIDEINNYNFTNSTIIRCNINDIEFIKLKYKSILNRIYEIINDGSNIIKNTILNIKTLEKKDDGFYYLKDLGISVQGVNSNKCLKEIFIQAKQGKIKLRMTVYPLNGYWRFNAIN